MSEIVTHWGVSEEGTAVCMERDMGNGLSVRWIATVEELNLIMARVAEVQKKLESAAPGKPGQVDLEPASVVL